MTKRIAPSKNTKKKVSRVPAKKAAVKSARVIHIDPLESQLKRKLRKNLKILGFSKTHDGALTLPGSGKDMIRSLHAGHRKDKIADNKVFLAERAPSLIEAFAHGREIDPSKIELRLIRVTSGTIDAEIFRLASLTWSVPVSQGFGRRMRYLVWDTYHDKLVGIFALGDPVFNLSVRDNLIGWSPDDRSNRLVNILDAYVLGAVPPYNMLLGGKAVACLIRSREVYDEFASSYGKTVGIISGEEKRARLLAVTTSSSMGRSSLYNRLRLGDQAYFDPIGYTVGWGHFHIDDALFNQMREFLRLRSHAYASAHKFGNGPNWRLRTIRATLAELGINPSTLKHGIRREVFLCCLASNAVEILKKGHGRPKLTGLETVERISDLAKDRWMIPRAERRPEYRAWNRSQIFDLIAGSPSSLLAGTG